MRKSLTTPADFHFGSAVCSHGFFVLAPNAWDPARRTLRTVISIDDRLAIAVEIRELTRGRLNIHSDAGMSSLQIEKVTQAVRRMLRLDEDLSPFHELCREYASHREAAAMRFGRLLRSAELFEDIVKVICTCNVGWRQTVAMVQRMVEYWGVPTTDGKARAFPAAQRLATVRPADLQARARVGYRAAFIHDLARAVADGSLDLKTLEQSERPPEDRYRRLREIRGVGDYAASHLCMLMGDYSRPAIDTEMVRLLRKRYPRKRLTPATISNLYRRWHPYQYLAYWYELWSDYVARHGRSDLWTPTDVGPQITATNRARRPRQARHRPKQA
jgi:3-methyladenine DNA glycosylase/8-oxoguanine DNA glycosylase